MRSRVRWTGAEEDSGPEFGFLSFLDWTETRGRSSKLLSLLLPVALFFSLCHYGLVFVHAVPRKIYNWTCGGRIRRENMSATTSSRAVVLEPPGDGLVPHRTRVYTPPRRVRKVYSTVRARDGPKTTATTTTTVINATTTIREYRTRRQNAFARFESLRFVTVTELREARRQND